MRKKYETGGVILRKGNLCRKMERQRFKKVKNIYLS